MKDEDGKEGKKPGRPRRRVGEAPQPAATVCAPHWGPLPASPSTQPRQGPSRAQGSEPESEAPPSGSRTTFPNPD